jgi:hypothetical protein
MTQQEMITLDPYATYADKPFTDLANTWADLMVLDSIRTHLRAMLNGLPECVNNGQLYGQLFERYHYRVVLLNRRDLLGDQPMNIVGFCGQRRPDVNPGLLTKLDAELVDELSNHPYMLAYSSHEQPDGNWVNLVVMSSAPQVERWRASARHAYAARELSPDYYATIRLHSGRLAAGLNSPGLQLTRTMYYDFQAGGWWQAVRPMASE